jgi:cell division initiation protein
LPLKRCRRSGAEPLALPYIYPSQGTKLAKRVLAKDCCSSILQPVNITPLDIRQRRFETSFHGYSKAEVESFLELVATEFEEVVKQSISYKEELAKLQQRLENQAERERTLQETLVTAHRMSEDLKVEAKREAEFIVSQAEHQAEKIVESAHQKLVEVVKDINELKRQRVQFESQVRSVIDAHSKLLETFRQSTFAEGEWERIDDNVSFLAPTKAVAAKR